MRKTDFFKALSDQTRLRCLLLLQEEGELCVCDMVEALNLSQPLVSRHLAHLRSLEIVQDERRGQWVHYRLRPSLPSWATEVISIVGRAEAHTEQMREATERLAAALAKHRGRCD